MKRYIKNLLTPILFRHINSGLQPERLLLYLRTIVENKDIAGSVLEVGCDVCGTAIIANKMLRNLGIKKEYYALDTFEGFIENQFEKDVQLGTSKRTMSVYNNKSLNLVKKILKIHCAEDITLIKADIVKLTEDELPNPICVCLLDVDIEVPIYEGLKKIYPRLSNGGVVIIDDCSENNVYRGARIGYEKFCGEKGIQPSFEFGAGVLRKRAM